MRAWLPVFGIAAICVVVIALVASSGGEGKTHEFSVTVKEAANVVKGQPIRQAGVKVGQIKAIEPVDKGRAAKLTLELEDRVWPLPKGSTMGLRWGGTASFANRYIDLVPGKQGGSLVADGGVLPTKALSIPVEFDQLQGAFPKRVRNDVKRMLVEAGPALDNAKPGLRKALVVAPGALDQGSHALADLDSDEAALDTLVKATDRVVGAVNAANPGLREVLDGAGGTFDAIADEASATQQGLSGAPKTFQVTRTTLKRADTTLVTAQDISRRIAPGVTEIRKTAQPLVGVLSALRTVGPDAETTLATARRAVPYLNPLLGKVKTLSPELKSIGSQTVDNLNCIRPFTPDILAFFTNWGDYFSVPDKTDKLIRAQVQNYGPAITNVQSITPGQAAKSFPGLTYGFPRPPGYNAGQPWFLPECGAGPDALDPNQDPEAVRGGNAK